MKLAEWIAYRLPRSVVYWAMIRAGAEVTTGKYGNTLVPELTFMDALKRYEDGT
jgi:hypothetical protein